MNVEILLCIGSVRFAITNITGLAVAMCGSQHLFRLVLFVVSWFAMNVKSLVSVQIVIQKTGHENTAGHYS